MKQSKYKYIAHSENSNGAEQSMKQHSESVAELMRSFALADDFAEIYWQIQQGISKLYKIKRRKGTSCKMGGLYSSNE